MLFDREEDFATVGVESQRRKLWRFAGDVYLAHPEVLPLFPMSLRILMIYTVWLSFNGINGMKSLGNYISIAMAFQLERGFPDSRKESPMHIACWARFWRRASTRLTHSVPLKKWPLPASLLECLAIAALNDAHVYLRWRDITMWVIAWFSGLRVGHWSPSANGRHVLRWCDVQLQEDKILIFLRSTKTRALTCTEGTWTAVAARPDGLVTLDPLRLMLRWKEMSFHGDLSQPLFHGAGGKHKTMPRTEFTSRLRQQLNVAGIRLGVDLQLARYAGISFRKAAACGLWDKIGHQRLMEMLDHSSYDACLSYGHDSHDSRASNTHVLAAALSTGM